MKLDELLAGAKSACRLMDTEMCRDRGTLERAAQYAAIAQGYAMTAQAMIDYQRWVMDADATSDAESAWKETNRD